MLGINSTGAQRFSKDDILYQIDNKDAELDIENTFIIINRSILRDDTVMIDRILNSEYVIKKYQENKNNEIYFDNIISTINSNVISYDIFIKCYNISPKLFLDKLDISVCKYLISSKDRDKFIRFFGKNNVNVNLVSAEEIINTPLFHNIKFANYLASWDSFTKYLKNPELYWKEYHYIYDAAKKMEHVMKIVLRRKKIETLLSKI